MTHDLLNTLITCQIFEVKIVVVKQKNWGFVTDIAVWYSCLTKHLFKMLEQITRA
jgi:hypothetical protein